MSPWTVLGWMFVAAFAPVVLMTGVIGAALVVGLVAKAREEMAARDQFFGDLEDLANYGSDAP